MFVCGRCRSKLTEGPQCSLCKQHFDYPCAGITETGFRKLGTERRSAWKCNACRIPSSSSVIDTSSPAPPKQLSTDLELVMAEIKKVSEKLAPLNTLVDEMREVKTDLNELKISIDFVHSRMKEVDDKVTSVDKRLSDVEKSAENYLKLEDSIMKIEQEMNDKDQWSRLNNIEVKGVPFKQDENLFDILYKIAAKAGLPLSKEQISFVSRTPSRIKDMPKPIIASFNNRYVKENLVSAVRDLKGLISSDLGFQDHAKVYVNDHLTVANKMLLSKAKKLAKENHFQFIWVKQCKIMLRKNPTSPIIIMKTDADLKKIH